MGYTNGNNVTLMFLDVNVTQGVIKEKKTKLLMNKLPVNIKNFMLESISCPVEPKAVIDKIINDF